MSNKHTFAVLFSLLFILMFVFFGVPYQASAQFNSSNVPPISCSDGGTSCGTQWTVTISTDCTATSGVNNSIGETCNNSTSFPAGQFQSGDFTAEIFGGPVYITTGNFDDYGSVSAGTATWGKGSSGCGPISGSGSAMGTMGEGGTLFVSATNGCPNNDPNNTVVSVAGTSGTAAAIETLCYTDATGINGHTGGSYVPTAWDVCTYVPPPGSKPSIGVSAPPTITLSSGQDSDTETFYFWNAGDVGSTLHITGCPVSSTLSIDSSPFCSGNYSR